MEKEQLREQIIEEFVKSLIYGRKQDVSWIIQFMKDYLLEDHDGCCEICNQRNGKLLANVCEDCK